MKRYGHPGVVELQPILRFTSTGGWVSVRYWEGTTDQMRAIASSAKLNGAVDIEMIPEREGRKATCSATFGSADDSTPESIQMESVWELDENQGDISIWEHPKVKAIFSGYDVNQQCELRADIEKLALGQQQDSAYGDVITALLLGSTDFQQFLKRLTSSNGQATFYRPDAILRHTLVAPQTYKFSYVWDDIATLWTTAEIQAGETSLGFVLPPSRIWIHRFPRLQSTSAGKLQVIREWWECADDDWLYL